jgi:omega-amidase
MLQNDLSIALIQSPLHWQQPDANRAMFEEKIWQLSPMVDVVILPEMFTTGFSMEAQQLAEPMNTHTTRWMKQMAAQKGAVITGSFIINDGGKYFNRLLWVYPDGQVLAYNKRHLFRMAGEHQHYAAGSERIICEWKGWRICPLICYDLRFPVWSRNFIAGTKDPAYDLLLYVANWPAARVNAWDALLTARAIENLAYVAGVNRTGSDGLGIAYNGHSAVVDGRGISLIDLQETEQSKEVTLSASSLMQLREKFPAFLDADDFNLV